MDTPEVTKRTDRLILRGLEVGETSTGPGYYFFRRKLRQDDQSPVFLVGPEYPGSPCIGTTPDGRAVDLLPDWAHLGKGSEYDGLCKRD